MITNFTQNDNGHPMPFVIGDYLDLLTPVEGQKGKYICTNCNAPKLSIAADGKKYNCYNCYETKRIAYLLREKRGEFNKKATSCTAQDAYSSKTSADTNSIKGYPATLAFLREKWGDRLCWDVRRLKILLDGKDLNVDSIACHISDQFGINISQEISARCVFYLARKNEVDPVKNYLLSLEVAPNPPSLRNFLPHLMELKTELHRELLYRWLIGCVARVMDPGVKFDEVLVLVGREGIGKSGFFRALSSPFFSDSLGSQVGKPDELRKLHRSWICEWGELDRISASTYHGTIKHFLSQQEDEFRLPYAKDLEWLPRRSVLVGTTNSNNFLADPGINRRFWIIPVDKEIDPIDIEVNQDDLWATALAEWKRAGAEGHHLPRKFWEASAEANKDFCRTDPWEDLLVGYIELKREIGVSTQELLAHLEGNKVPIAYSKAEQMRLGDLLQRLGWVRRRVRRGDKLSWRYFPCSPSF